MGVPFFAQVLYCKNSFFTSRPAMVHVQMQHFSAASSTNTGSYLLLFQKTAGMADIIVRLPASPPTDSDTRQKSLGQCFRGSDLQRGAGKWQPSSLTQHAACMAPLFFSGLTTRRSVGSAIPFATDLSALSSLHRSVANSRQQISR